MKYVGMKHFPPPEGANRPCGWFTANGLVRYGPLPRREQTVQATWPPHELEAPLTIGDREKREA